MHARLAGLWTAGWLAVDGRLDIFTQTTLRGSMCAQTVAQCDAARAHLDSLVFRNGQGSPAPLGAVSGGRWPRGGVRRACDVRLTAPPCWVLLGNVVMRR